MNRPLSVLQICTGVSPPYDKTDLSRQHALHYAELGYATVPLYAASKKPATKHGHKDAVSKPELINRQFAEVKGQAKGLGVAIVPDESVVVVDIDPRHGGDEKLAELEAEHGLLPPTATVSTGNGGEHRYFRVPVGVRLTSKKIADGIELKTAGSGVVAPPSIHPDTKQEYFWQTEPIHRVNLPDIPQWVIDLWKQAQSRERKTEPDAVEEEILLWWYKFDLRSYLGGTVQSLRDYQRGWLTNLMAYAWQNKGYLPTTEPEALARLANADDRDRFIKERDAVLFDFETVSVKDGDKTREVFRHKTLHILWAVSQRKSQNKAKGPKARAERTRRAKQDAEQMQTEDVRLEPVGAEDAIWPKGESAA